MSETIKLKVSILDKSYEITCSEDQAEALKASALHLDERMRQIQSSGKAVGLDRVAVVAALNIANDYLSNERLHRETIQRIDALSEKVGQALREQEPPKAD